MWAASGYNSSVNWQIENLEAGCKHSLLWCHFEIECWVIAWMRLYIMLVCWCLSSLSYLKTCLPLCFAVAIAMPETMEISDAAKSGDGTTQNVGIKARLSLKRKVFCSIMFDDILAGEFGRALYLFCDWIIEGSFFRFGSCIVKALVQEVGASFQCAECRQKFDSEKAGWLLICVMGWLRRSNRFSETDKQKSGYWGSNLPDLLFPLSVLLFIDWSWLVALHAPPYAGEAVALEIHPRPKPTPGRLRASRKRTFLKVDPLSALFALLWEKERMICRGCF